MAVHAIAGEREKYRPLKSHFGRGENPKSLIESTLVRLPKSNSFYVADLDCITECDTGNRELIYECAVLGRNMWLDAGFSTEKLKAGKLADYFTSLKDSYGELFWPIFSTESTSGPKELHQLIQQASCRNFVVSVDIKDGLLFSKFPGWLGLSMEQAIDQVAKIAKTIVVLDLGTVGKSCGANTELIQTTLEKHDDINFYWGGGIRDDSDLKMLCDVGAKGALVGTALHCGNLVVDCQN